MSPPDESEELDDLEGLETTELHVLRHMIDPPGEAFEATYRDALAGFKRLGSSGGFLLLTATGSLDGGYEAGCYLSGGEGRIPLSHLVEMLNAHLEGL